MPASRPAFRLIQGSGFGNAVSFPDRLFDYWSRAELSAMRAVQETAHGQIEEALDRLRAARQCRRHAENRVLRHEAQRLGLAWLRAVR
jgi:hypothetical protein